MDRLWAPWRTKYITNVNSMKGCIFCSKPGSGSDRKARIIERSKYSFSILNIYPYNNGHLMIVPFRHVNSLTKLTDAELLDMLRLLNKTQRMLEKALKPDGFNIGVNIGRSAGAGVRGHVHMHIVPRWNGDVNFMPIFASSKVISQSLDSLYAILKKCSREKI
ncbi:MAG: HIT domain-containing protein [Candidatus Omnitrophota bacterium]